MTDTTFSISRFTTATAAAVRMGRNGLALAGAGMVAVDRVADMALGSIGAMADGVVPASVMMLVAFVLPGAVKLAVDFRPALAGVRLVLVDRVADMALDNVANYVGGMVDGIVPTCVAIFLTFIIPCAFKIVLNFAMSSLGK